MTIGIGIATNYWAPKLFCPECNEGTLEIVTDGEVGVPYATAFNSYRDRPIEVRMESKPFAACNACEFCLVLELKS